jgi:hypothetical protein
MMSWGFKRDDGLRKTGMGTAAFSGRRSAKSQANESLQCAQSELDSSSHQLINELVLRKLVETEAVKD